MKFERQDFYQFLLIIFAALVVGGVSIFIYKELYPEYKIYQNIYIDLEKFRSSYTGSPPAPFTTGVKQILIPNESGGPEIVDRCISCHVAADLPHFSPTRIARDVNDRIMIDSDGSPVLEKNPDYVWAKLDDKIAWLRDSERIKQLRLHGQTDEIEKQLTEAEELESLRTVKIEGKEIDIRKAIQMHPLIGREIRPFQYHSISEYGCTTCHSGNGQALVAKRAHGPVFDGEYEPAAQGKKPQFTEEDFENDPRFARMYNDKPGHELVFQTTPILAGSLIEAKCVQCHQSTQVKASNSIDQFSQFTQQKREEIEKVQEGIMHEKAALTSLLILYRMNQEEEREGVIEWLNAQLGNPNNSSEMIDAYAGQLSFVKQHDNLKAAIFQRVEEITGSHETATELMHAVESGTDIPALVEKIFSNPTSDSIRQKQSLVEENRRVIKLFDLSEEPFKDVLQNKTLVNNMQTKVDKLISSYTRGKELFISQACYSCHKIAGFSRGSVGPELTQAGNSYPWFIKESIVWPQADLPSSTMPNFRLDHEEISDLMTFLMAQKGETKAISEVDYQIKIGEWEKGAKMPWEKPIPPTDIYNLQAGQLVFATQGCAACHLLEGFESNLGLDGQNAFKNRERFRKIFPHGISGSLLARRIEEEKEWIENQIVEKSKKKSILDEIETYSPELLMGFYANFRFASRAYNTTYKNDPQRLQAYQRRLHKVLMLYIQEYGLGRDIAPHLSYSGIYRDDAWLLGHFHNPPAYTGKSIMPVMPFDDTKFYMLNHMLHVLGRKNREDLHEIWRVKGFQPAAVYETLCSSCHGANRQGNGIVAEWIYPIPKNLRNPIFLRSLTKERAIDSIMHGVKGTPMPPWGETAPKSELGDSTPVLSHSQIEQLVDWLYQGVPEEDRFEKIDEQKWSYSPQHIVEEMKKEDDLLQPAPPNSENIQEDIDAYFVVRSNPDSSPDKELYFIRDTYYTPQNLEKAKHYFNVNCATCHGKEGTGTGLRASSMVESKPRMFTNLPWIRSRDDLRLLRSIKYGVPGTSMTPWGDQTTAAQRMQLVMYIREMTRSTLLRDDLNGYLYNAFNKNYLLVEQSRIDEYRQLETLLAQLKEKENALLMHSESDTSSPMELGSLYSEVVKLKKLIQTHQAQDNHFRELLELIREEEKIYETIGSQAIAAKLPEPMILNFFSLIENLPLTYRLQERDLTLKENLSKREKNDLLVQKIVTYLDREIAAYQVIISQEEAKIRDPNRGKRIEELMDEQGVLINFKTKLLVGLSNAEKNREKQKATWRRGEKGQ